MRNRRGSALIEFALAFAVLAPAAVAAIQFTLSWVHLNQLELAVQLAAREASTWAWDPPGTEPSARFRRRVENLVLYGGADQGDAVLIPGLSREHVRIEMAFDQGLPRRLTVSISGFRLLLPRGAPTLDGRPSAAFPFRGRLAWD